MTPPQPWGARVVLAWVRAYTISLPAAVAAERREELRSDVHDQAADAHASGLSPRRLSWTLLGRMLRGAPADVAWRAEVEAELSGRPVSLARPGVVLVALGLLALPFWAAGQAEAIAGASDPGGPGSAWLVACLIWAVSISYGLIALAYLAVHRRRPRPQ